MRSLLSGVIFLLLAGCSSMQSYQSGDIVIRTSQLRENTLKIMLYDLDRQPVQQAALRVTNNRGDILDELELRKRIAFIQYPMHESSIFIEATDNKGNKGARQFFRSQLRQVPIMTD